MGIESWNYMYLLAIGILILPGSKGVEYIQNDRVVNIYKDGVDVMWDPIPFATKYNVSLFNVMTIKTPLIMSTMENKVSYRGIKRLVSPNILIKVTAFNGTDYDEFPGVKSRIFLKFQFNNDERPKVSNLTSTDVTASSISLSWTHFSNATRYRVSYLYNGNKYINETIQNKMTLPTLKHNTDYTIYCEVIEVNNSKLDFPIRSDSLVKKTLEIVIDNLNVVNTTRKSITLTWNVINKAITTFKVYYTKASEINYSTNIALKNEITLTNLEANTEYKIFIEVDDPIHILSPQPIKSKSTMAKTKEDDTSFGTMVTLSRSLYIVLILHGMVLMLF